jgi:predicted restriction endonuclease
MVSFQGDAMALENPHINPYLFEQQVRAFKSYVEEQSGLAFVSFASNPYTEKQEGYKYEIHRAGREALAFQAWKQSDIGTGDIVGAVIAAIEIPNSNLVPWQGRFGKEARPHQPLYEAENQQDQLPHIEECLFKLYREEHDEESFARLVGVFGKTYPLIAYLFFLKDRSKYLPIAPTFFDRAFEHLGAEFKTAHRCSWENYSIYVALIGELKAMLTENLGGEVTLLDAHSFAWMLAAQMAQENKLANVQEYLSLPATEREAIVKARVGQGKFRQTLINYWSVCAVTGCKEEGLLRASHIKPWAKATLVERLSLYNGLLLSPALDACFDSGYVSFDDDGRILISERFRAEDAYALGINADMRLKRVEPEHKKYLAFHREMHKFT